MDGLNTFQPKHRVLVKCHQNNELKFVLQKSSGEAEDDFVAYIGKWRDAGASLFGGCCRTTPNTIRGITEALRGKLQSK